MWRTGAGSIHTHCSEQHKHGCPKLAACRYLVARAEGVLLVAFLGTKVFTKDLTADMDVFQQAVWPEEVELAGSRSQVQHSCAQERLRGWQVMLCCSTARVAHSCSMSVTPAVMQPSRKQETQTTVPDRSCPLRTAASWCVRGASLCSTCSPTHAARACAWSSVVRTQLVTWCKR